MRKICSLWLLGAFIALGSCTKDDPDPSVEFPDEVAQEGSILTSQGQPVQTVTFNANRDWSVVVTAVGAGDVSWLHVSPLSGLAGEGSLRISGDANPTTEARVAQVNVLIEGLTKSFRVTQLQKDALVLTNDQVTVPAAGADFQVRVSANVDITAEVPSEYASWLSRVSTLSMTSSVFTFRAEPYQGYENRLGKIVVKDLSSTVTDTVYVTQKTSLELPTLYVKTAGGLDQALKDATQQRDTITTLIVLGNLNASDFQTLRADLLDLKRIDLSGVTFENNKLPDNAFMNHVSLAEIVLPEGLTEIGDNAFMGVSTLACPMKIPEGVTRIGDNAFASTKITGTWADMIPASITELGVGAFSGCSKITGGLVLPANLTEIPASLFYNCSGLTGQIVLPERITGIGDQAFYYTGISGMLDIPASVKSLGNYAFASTKITGLQLHDGLETIGEWAFWQCRQMAGKLVIPNTVTSVGLRAFDNCTSLTGLQLSESMTEIPNQLFQYCSAMTGELVIPASIKSIGTNAFLNTKFTGKLVIPATLESIGSSAFQSNQFSSVEFAPGCQLTQLSRTFVYNESLSGDIVIPESITQVLNGAFERTAITSLTLPATLTAFGNDVLSSCKTIQRIVCLAETPAALLKSNNTAATSFSSTPTCPLFVPQGCVEAYKAATAYGWKDMSPIIPIGGSTDSDVSIDDMTNSDGQWK